MAATQDLDEIVQYQMAVNTLSKLQVNKVQLEKNSAKQRDISFMEDFLMEMGIQPSDLNRLKAIHVTGTKGKGSVSAMCEIVLRKHNLKTGFFSSPHLLEVRDRIRLDGKPLSKPKFTSYFWECYNKLKDSKEINNYKFITVMAFYVFLQEKVDVAVIEVIIGGAVDATNILRKSSVCAVTSIDYDHMDLLGDTLEKIAWHKSGIFKPGCSAFTSPLLPGPMRVLAERAAELQASSLRVAPPLSEYRVTTPPLKLGLAGLHQQANASLAVQVCREWLHKEGKLTEELPEFSIEGENKQLDGIPIARPFQLPEPFQKGLEQCQWPGRSQVIKNGHVTYYLDGAHTPESAKLCSEWFKTETRKEAQGSSCVRVLLFNIIGDRDPKVLMAPFLDCGFHYAAFTPNIVFPNGNPTDQSAFHKEQEFERVQANCQTWLKVNHCIDFLELFKEAEQHSFAQSNGGGEKNGTAIKNGTAKFNGSNARTFSCVSDAVGWCGSRDHAPSNGHPVVGAERIQVLVTGSLYLVGMTMVVLGYKVDDIV